MQHINTPESIYNKMIDVTKYSETHQKKNRIKKFDHKERTLAVKIIKDLNHNPVITKKEQKTLNSMGEKLFTEETFKKKSCWEKTKAIFGNIFGKRIASRKLINPLIKAQKVQISQNQPVNPIQPKPAPQSTNEKKFISRLKKGTPVQQKKAFLYEQAEGLFNSKGCNENLTTCRLDPGVKAQFDKKNPDWLKQPFNHFNPQRVNMTNNDQFYDYKPHENKTNVWVDFANSALGGGAGVEGFVQEEIMFVEFWDLFRLLPNTEDKNRPFWSNLDIRSGDVMSRNQVGQGNPEPLLIRNAHRVQQVPRDLYGSHNKVNDKTGKILTWGIEDIPMNDLKKKVTPLDNPQEAHILSIAAPKLFRRDQQEQYAPETLKDIFNQLMAGFTLAKEKEPNLCIHSGPFGCGAFNNSPKAVWLLHRLAASQLEIEVVMHAYNNSYEDAWNEISPDFQYRTLGDSIDILSDYLLKNPN
jgi:hypothetical protein